MKKKCLFKLLAFAVVWAMVFSCACPASALVPLDGAASALVQVTAEYPNGLYVKLTTSSYDVSDRQPIGLRVEHNPGATTTLSLSVGESATSTASASLGFSVTEEVGMEIGDAMCLLVNAKISGTLSAQVDVGYAVTHSVESEVTYTFDSTIDPGLYSCYVVFPRKTVQSTVYTYDSRGNLDTIGSKTIIYAPRLTDIYITWDSYQLGS